LLADRPKFLAGFLADFFNVDVLGGKRISDEAVRTAWTVGMSASPIATRACVRAWLTDFRPDLARIEIPTLIVHGDDDRIVPLAISGTRTHEAVHGSRLVTIQGGPHGINWTHADEVNRALLGFRAAGD
jgi:pimeloyl-ACP methyl ester carboxylesterase